MRISATCAIFRKGIFFDPCHIGQVDSGCNPTSITRSAILENNGVCTTIVSNRIGKGEITVVDFHCIIGRSCGDDIITASHLDDRCIFRWASDRIACVAVKNCQLARECRCVKRQRPTIENHSVNASIKRCLTQHNCTATCAEYAQNFYVAHIGKINICKCIRRIHLQ